MVKWPKEGTLRGKHAHLWNDEMDLIKSFPVALPDVYFFRHVESQGATAGTQFGPTLWNQWVKRACTALDVPHIGLYALVKHSTMTALSKELTPEQIRRGGSKHTSKAIERYMLPEIGETKLVQSTLKRMQRGEVVPIRKRSKREIS